MAIALGKQRGVGILLGSLAFALTVAVCVSPIPQSLSYHHFADVRDLLGLANFWNVISNLPFALVGLAGLWHTEIAGRRGVFENVLEIWPYRIFFLGVAIVSLGSSWYHYQPGNDELVWDRLPMTVAFMALVSALVADRIDLDWGVRIVLPILLAAGVASVAYWAATEAAGHGDLRFYGLVQFYPMLAIPLICWFFPDHRILTGRDIIALFAFYILAKLLENFDRQVFDLFGGWMSGHSLKHVAAAGAPAVAVHRLKRL